MCELRFGEDGKHHMLTHGVHRDGVIRFTMDAMGEHMMLAIFTEAEFTQLSLPG